MSDLHINNTGHICQNILRNVMEDNIVSIFQIVSDYSVIFS